MATISLKVPLQGKHTLNSPVEKPYKQVLCSRSIINIFSYLDPLGLQISKTVSKTWDTFARGAPFWKEIRAREIALQCKPIKTPSSFKNLRQITRAYGAQEIIDALQVNNKDKVGLLEWVGDGPLPIYHAHMVSAELIKKSETITEETLCAMLGKQKSPFTQEELESLSSHLTYRDLPDTERQEIRRNLFSRLMPLLTGGKFTCVGFTAGDGAELTFGKKDDMLCFECGDITIKINKDGFVISSENMTKLTTGLTKEKEEHFFLLGNEKMYNLHSPNQRYTMCIGNFQECLYIRLCDLRERGQSPVIGLKLSPIKGLLNRPLAYMDYVVSKLEDIEAELRVGQRTTTLEQRMITIASTLLVKLASVTTPREMLITLNQALTEHSEKSFDKMPCIDYKSLSLGPAKREENFSQLTRVSLEGIFNMSLGPQDSLHAISLERTTEEAILTFEKISEGRGLGSTANRTARFIKKRNHSMLRVEIGKKDVNYNGQSISKSVYEIDIRSNQFCVTPCGEGAASIWWPLAIIIDNIPSSKAPSVSVSLGQQPSQKQREDLVYLYRIFNTIIDFSKHPNTLILERDEEWNSRAYNIHGKRMPRGYLQSLLKKEQGTCRWLSRPVVDAALALHQT